MIFERLKIYPIQKLLTLIDIIATTCRTTLTFPLILTKSLYCSKVVWMVSGGFGHTIHGPDVARIFLSGRILFIISEWPGRVNRETQNLWESLETVYVPLFLQKFSHHHILVRDIFVRTLNFIYKKKFIICTDRYGREFSPSELYFLPFSYSNVGRTNVSGITEDSYLERNGNSWTFGYLKRRSELQNNNRISQVEKLKYEGIRNTHFEKTKKILIFYARRKNLDSRDITSSSRQSLPISDSAELFSLFESRDIICLVVGDEILSSNLRKSFPLVFDYQSLKMTREKFYVFSSFIADYCIGAAGGGLWLPNLINNPPTLILNCFPIGFAVPNSFILNKQLLDSHNGQPVHDQKVLEAGVFRYQMDGIEFKQNTTKQVLQATSLFLDHVQYGRNISNYFRPAVSAVEGMTGSRPFDLRSLCN